MPFPWARKQQSEDGMKEAKHLSLKGHQPQSEAKASTEATAALTWTQNRPFRIWCSLMSFLKMETSIPAGEPRGWSGGIWCHWGRGSNCRADEGGGWREDSFGNCSSRNCQHTKWPFPCCEATCLFSSVSPSPHLWTALWRSLPNTRPTLCSLALKGLLLLKMPGLWCQ